MAETLESRLEEFNKTSEIKVVFDSADSKFYQVVEGSKKELKFPDHAMSEKDGFASSVFGISNEVYAARLPESYRTLRNIVIEQVGKLVKNEMVKQGVMYIGKDGIAHSAHLGACHTIWRYKKCILKDYYNIEWASPADEDPGTLFD